MSRLEGLVIYDITYEIVGTDVDDDEAVVATIVLSVIYGVLDGASVSDDDLPAFGTVSVLFTAHPYLRELLQSLTGRMGLPPLILDLMLSPFDVSQQISAE